MGRVRIVGNTIIHVSWHDPNVNLNWRVYIVFFIFNFHDGSLVEIQRKIMQERKNEREKGKEKREEKLLVEAMQTLEKSNL